MSEGACYDLFAMARFLSKLKYDAGSGCVLWIGGKTSGQHNDIEYGSFWYRGRRWFAHRWAARFIHGMEIDGMEVDHKCRNPLCVEHLQPLEKFEHCQLTIGRRIWGWDDWPERNYEVGGVPFFPEPDWFKKLTKPKELPL